MEHVDLIVFAGQSNMSGRGTAADAVICDSSAGYEYKAVSSPDELQPIREPFGLGEDKEGAIWDYDSDGSSKRTGSMVSAAVDVYHGLTGRRIVGVSASVGGSDTVQWKQLYLKDAVERLEKAKYFLAENSFIVERIFVVWCQGESDGDAGRSVEEYTANTREIFEAFRRHGAEKCFLVQIGHYNYAAYPDTEKDFAGRERELQYKVIRDAQAALCLADEYFIQAGSFEPHIGDMKDAYHYHQTAYDTVGRAVGAAMAEYVTAQPVQ